MSNRTDFRLGSTKRTLLTITGATLSVALIAACQGAAVSSKSSPESAGDVLKVGLVTPLSGPYAGIGKDVQHGFELYLKQHHGKLGTFQVQLVRADEGSSPDTGIPAVQRLINQDKVDVIVGVVSSAVATGIRDVVDAAKTPTIFAVAATSGKPSAYTWRASQTPVQPGAALGPYVAKHGMKTAYLIASDYVAGHDNVEAFAKAFKAAGGHVVGESYTPFGTTTDWQPYLSKIKQASPDMVYAFYAGSEAVSFVKQYHQFGIQKRVPLYGTGFLTMGDVLPAQGSAASGIYTSNNYSTELKNSRNKAFIAAFKQEYGGLPTGYTLQAYDAANMIDLAAASTKTPDSASIESGLKKLSSIDSPRGTFRLNGQHDPIQTFYLRKVEKTKGGYVNAIVADLGETEPE